MAEQPNFLLSKGEYLTRPIVIKKSSGETKLPYTFDEARDHLSRSVAIAREAFDALPDVARDHYEKAMAAIVKLHGPDHAQAASIRKVLETLK